MKNGSYHLLSYWLKSFLLKTREIYSRFLYNLVLTFKIKSQKWYYRAACAEPKALVLKPRQWPDLSDLIQGGSQTTSFAEPNLYVISIIWWHSSCCSFTSAIPSGFLSPCCHWTYVPIWTKKMQARNSSESTQEEHLTRKIFRIISKTGLSVPIVRCF